MSKVSLATCRTAVQAVIQGCEEKKRNFTESIELQIGLKNIDIQREKRFSGSLALAHTPRPNMKICVFGDAAHCEKAAATGLDSMSVDDLKKFNRDKKLVKKLAKKYDAFLASETIIKQIPRLLGPGLTRSGKFPTPIAASDDLRVRAEEIRSSIKLQLKKAMCLAVVVGYHGMPEEQIVQNTQNAVNFLASLLRKGWQNVNTLYLKSTMGKPQILY